MAAMCTCAYMASFELGPCKDVAHSIELVDGVIELLELDVNQRNVVEHRRRFLRLVSVRSRSDVEASIVVLERLIVVSEIGVHPCNVEEHVGDLL